MPPVRLALAQINPIAGTLAPQMDRIVALAHNAFSEGAELLATGAWAISGYPLEDLANRVSFLRDVEQALTKLATRLADDGLAQLPVIVGYPNAATSRAALLHRGEVQFATNLVQLENTRVRVFPEGLAKTQIVEAAEADLLLVLEAKPFEQNLPDSYFALACLLAKQAQLPVAVANLAGGQDDLVFAGESFWVNDTGRLLARAAPFREDLLIAPLGAAAEIPVQPIDQHEHIWNALVTALSDYCRKNHFRSVILGLSGGIDSAVCAALAVDALGADRVYGVSMPSKFSSPGSLTDAEDLAKRTGLHYQVQSISGFVEALETKLALTGVAAENLQARLRGITLMAKSNMSAHLVLSTGNKSEIALGYSTIYGDSVGGFAPLADVPKTLVWELARWRNRFASARGEIAPIPEASINKAPSAELRPEQTDQDTLPPYPILDAILAEYLEHKRGVTEIVSLGYDAETVSFIVRLVERAEWKRRQGAIGPKISRFSFGSNLRFPLSARNFVS